MACFAKIHGQALVSKEDKIMYELHDKHALIEFLDKAVLCD